MNRLLKTMLATLMIFVCIGSITVDHAHCEIIWPSQRAANSDADANSIAESFSKCYSDTSARAGASSNPDRDTVQLQIVLKTKHEKSEELTHG